MRSLRPRALWISGLFLAAACATGQRQFQAGQKAQTDGNLEAAEVAYKDALKEEPSNAEYKAAVDKVEAALALRYEEDAKAKEKAEDWSGASAAWSKASAARPGNEDYKARQRLSGLKALNLDPEQWYEGVKKVSAELPKNTIVEKSFANAKTKAYQLHLGLGDKYLGSNEGVRALQEYDRAKEIDPTSPGLDTEHYESAAALSLAQQGDQKLAEGDSLEAYGLYQRAFEKRPLPEIKAKLQKVKAKASALLAKVDSAKALSLKGKHLEALKIYESLAATKGVPPSVGEGLLAERAEVAKEESEKGEKAAEAGDLTRSKKAIEEALRYATLEPSALSVLKSALTEIEGHHPGKGMTALDEAKLDPREPLVKAVRAHATAAAKKSFEKAKALAKKDAAGTLAVLAELSPFEETIPAIKDLRASLRRDAFEGTLDEAMKAAKRGDDQEASTLLMAALNASSAPPEMRTYATEACDALKAKRPLDAELGFQKAIALEPKSKLALKGAEIARLRRREAEKQALETLKSGSGDEAAAVQIFEAAQKVDPEDPILKQAEPLLSARAAKAEKAEKTEKAEKAEKTEKTEKAEKTEKTEKAEKAEKKPLTAAPEAAAETKPPADDKPAPSSAKPPAEAKPAADSGPDAEKKALAEAALELKNGGDLDKGAKAAAKLLKIDPASREAKAAIDGAVALAEKAASGGDDKTAAKLLRAAAQASGESKDLSDGLIRYESGKYDDALKDLEKRSSELARRAYAIVKGRKVGNLKAGLAGDDRAQAEAIKALFAQDPANKEAQAALLKLLDKAKSLAAKGDEKGSEAALESATIASAVREDLAGALNAAAAQLGAKRYPEAEKGFMDALDLVRDSRVGKTGLEIAKAGREKAEKQAAAEIVKAQDPTGPAKVLRASLLVDPSSKSVASAFAALLQRAKKSSAKADDQECAVALDAAAILENGGDEAIEAVKSAGALMAKGSFEDAEAAYAAIEKSKAAEAGKELSRRRRVAVLKAELDSAKKDGDVLRQSKAAGAILSLDPQDKTALEMSKKLRASVVESRLQAARAEKESGKIGVAYLYLKRALEIDQKNAKAKAEIEALESSLKEGLDLIVLVDQIARAPNVVGTQCTGIEGPMREALMTEGSKRRDIGAYVLSPDWTSALERKDPKAPQVTGKLRVTLSKCQNGSATGNVTLAWALEVPPEHGTQVVKGSVDADLPAGLVPRDEQDGEGNNAKAALSRRAGRVLFDKLADERSAVDQWLLSVAEQGVKQRDSALAADAYARLMVKKPASLDASRVSVVERYLDAEYK